MTRYRESLVIHRKSNATISGRESVFCFCMILLFVILQGCENDEVSSIESDSSEDDIFASDNDSGRDTTDVDYDSDAANGTSSPTEKSDIDIREAKDSGFDHDAEKEDDDECVYSGPPVVDVEEFEECKLCDNAHCVPDGLVADEYGSDLADCEDGESKCVPDRYTETAGRFILDTCTSLEGNEGRCVSLCIPRVAALKDQLPIDICEDDERCAPCFDLITGDDTGTCSTSCDTGPANDEVVTFTECCGDLSVCVPESLVPEGTRTSLSGDDCSSKDYLCVPKGMATDPNGYVAKSCKSWDGAEGRCLPDCLPDVAKDADRLNQGDCPDNHLCAPCYDMVTGEKTASCTIAGDEGPQESAYRFSSCCDGTSVCVPKEVVPPSERSNLSQDDCKSSNALCVPVDMAMDPKEYIAQSCESWGGAEGRCHPACLPDIAAEADRLSKGSCPDNYLCAPCTDPITGQPTISCSIAGDPGPKHDPVIFSECCGGISVCVPEAAVPEENRSFLDGDSCSGADLCVPKEMAIDPIGYRPTSCRSWSGAEGRCLPACLPDVAEDAERLSQDVCPDDYLCVPCYDQISGESTSACDMAGDTGPEEEPVTFKSCCDGISVCVPVEAVPEGDRSSLSNQGCEGTDLCVPVELANDPYNYQPESCSSWNGAEARCLPACLPYIAENAARIAQETCPDDYLCAPCFDHVTQEETGACSIGSDPGFQQNPNEYVFPKCCGGTAVCTPLEAIPDEEEARLSVSDCLGEGVLCVPEEMALYPTRYGSDLEHCTSWGGAEGRCLLSCLADVTEVASQLNQGICGVGYLCVPCYDPVTGLPTDACTGPGDTLPQEVYTFPDCCMQGDTPRGVCVPSALVPEDQLESLPDEGCAEQGPSEEAFICAPIEFASDSSAVYPSNCQVSLLGERDGLCMADCFSTIKERDELQGSCSNDLDECLPCDFGAPCE